MYSAVRSEKCLDIKLLEISVWLCAVTVCHQVLSELIYICVEHVPSKVGMGWEILVRNS